MRSRSALIREAPPDETAPVLPWDGFMEHGIGPRGEFPWKQNQHLGLVGPTEQGKTNLAYHLIGLRDYVTYFSIKTDDETLNRFAEKGGYARIEDWPPRRRGRRGRALKPGEMPKRLLWPDAKELDAEHRQRAVFGRAMHDIYRQGGWCTVFDDFWYISQILGFARDTKKFLLNARSAYIPMVVCAQRPAGNHLVELFDQSTHLFFFRDNDEPNLKRIGGTSWHSSDLVRAHVAHLDPFQFLYVNTRRGYMYRSTAPEL